CMQVLEFPHTF
nr:immunoglobulin light chain junction region [Macaca mulatta]MOX49157.1 immunoglobulin light chain junction region [Macaca mulatta]MOX49185.1 immunoglobulin light chain junction region [Macaca mulatta]MOX50327.1 immunoglobulin light chain junction region [Macaca mulatta]MOX51010.1 immunoglobulin light chain junction region [Macaca mulatta]